MTLFSPIYLGRIYQLVIYLYKHSGLNSLSPKEPRSSETIISALIPPSFHSRMSPDTTSTLSPHCSSFWAWNWKILNFKFFFLWNQFKEKFHSWKFEMTTKKSRSILTLECYHSISVFFNSYNFDFTSTWFRSLENSWKQITIKIWNSNPPQTCKLTLSVARTKGPRPAPKTMTTCNQ